MCASTAPVILQAHGVAQDVNSAPARGKGQRRARLKRLNQSRGLCLWPRHGCGGGGGQMGWGRGDARYQLGIDKHKCVPYKR